MNISNFKTPALMTAHLAQEIEAKLTQAISENGKATLLVSGGKSPIALFELLNQRDLDWSKVIISLVDDRWVGTDNSDSNERLVNQYLLVNKAAAAQFVGLVGSQESAFDGIGDAVERINDIAQIDVMILGMGEDGHTASIFPCSSQVHDAMSADNKQRLIAVEPTTAPYQRISFTLNEILAAKQVYLPLSGEKKLAVFEQAQQLSDLAQMPISAVIKQHNALDVLVSE
ncbi:6-phosphogluconolactonase [Psychrobium sp. 1_MG-2023]|uniref:6-phosphogluconolactonase n=1 Tax=Psychrobium sp. 1_MG-2023 TaxID=3062624 RepID=UPI0026CB64A2|nr:6-phosphogluconolactonase [Psychrobium sp. 1_MG-2023]MDP2561163.1 6-phosphogluconolactonase [Psychrobium sp. 1_MG-2023]